MARCIQQEKEFNGEEIVIERPDGTRRTVLAHANPIHDEDGLLAGAVNVLMDITESKQTEVQLRRANEERASQYVQLQELHRRKDEFLATLAHELRNPLAPIQNAVQILRTRGPSDPTLQWARDVIDRQVRQTARLVEDLLDLSRITTGKLQLRRARLELSDVVRAALEISRPVLEAAGHELHIDLRAGAVSVNGDLTRLAQSLANLLNNAAKYTERGGRIFLSTERQGSDAVVTVRDTGIGIPGDMLPQVFDMFAQVNRSLNRSQGGLGIGLNLVKRVAELHGGSVTAQSGGPGKGSTFTLRLPVILEATPEPRPTNGDGLSGACPTSLRILVVDDNRDAAASLGMLLRILGNEVRTGHDGVEAVARAEEFRPDVILLDIGLPKMNGYDAARQIRQQSWGKRMSLIATTGWGQESDRHHSKEAGFDHHLVKPLDLTLLSQTLAALEKGMRHQAIQREAVIQGTERKA
jgi:signal transduction histidine kinase/CheY-like chemotaxis protein